MDTKLDNEQRAHLLEKIVSGEIKNWADAKRVGAAFYRPFSPSNKQYTRQRGNAGVEVGKIRAAERRSAAQTGLAVRDARINKLKRLFERHERLIEARAEEVSEIESGKTGLLAKDYRGKDADIPVYKYDAALIKEMRGLLDDLAKEVGDRTTKMDVTSDGKPLQVVVRVPVKATTAEEWEQQQKAQQE